MAKTPEGKVKDRIKAILKDAGAYFTMPVMTGMATNGTPDFAVCFGGYYLAVEAKAGSGTPTELQWVRLTEVVAAGGSTMVLNEDNLELLINWIAAIRIGQPQQVRAVRASTSRAVLYHDTVYRERVYAHA